MAELDEYSSYKLFYYELGEILEIENDYPPEL